MIHKIYIKNIIIVHFLGKIQIFIQKVYMQNESQIIEYKESWRDEYLKWICGFANAQGGRILIGVNDKKEVVGVENAKRLMEDIPNKVRDVLGIIVDVNLHEKDGLDYIEILVDPYPYPINYKGEYHYRSGSTKQELKGAALDQFLLRKRGMTWDAVPQPNMKVEELDSESIEIFKQQAVRSQRMSKADLEGNKRELLEKLHLFEGDYLKRSAALLFHNDPEKFITGAYIKIGFFKTDADLLYQDEIHGSLFQQVRQTMDLLTTKYLKSMIFYDDLQRIDKLPVPRSALREAVLNSIVHKSYGSFIPIQISVYDDKLMIWNAAALPTGWTIETLMKKHSSQPYNPEIANAFFRAGEIEAWGRGIERILLTERQKDILSLLSSDGTLTIEEMSKRLGISEKTIYRELSLLKANGHIERKGSKTKGEWVVKENI